MLAQLLPGDLPREPHLETRASLEEEFHHLFEGRFVRIPNPGITKEREAAEEELPSLCAAEGRGHSPQGVAFNPAQLFGDSTLNRIFDFEKRENSEDLNRMVDWILGRLPMPSPGEPAFEVSDVDGDNAIGMRDLNLYVDCILGRITKFPVDPDGSRSQCATEPPAMKPTVSCFLFFFVFIGR